MNLIGTNCVLFLNKPIPQVDFPYVNVNRNINNINISNITTMKHGSFPFYILQVGFNKAGTTSLANFFDDNNIPSTHWTVYMNNNTIEISKLMQLRYANNEPLLMDFADKYMFYSDFNAPYKIFND
eukprot:144734_1